MILLHLFARVSVAKVHFFARIFALYLHLFARDNEILNKINSRDLFAFNKKTVYLYFVTNVEQIIDTTLQQ